MSDTLTDKEKTLKWCLKRQMNGFHGRTNKPDDTCYSFWIGASIDMLGGIDYIHKEINFDFLLFAQSKFGGFSKYPGGFPGNILYNTII
jgi:geranylgeranyl transferase type-1 subunit beta